MAEGRPQIELDVAAALECAEQATEKTNELVGRTLETEVSGKEAAATLHHAYSAQVHVARVLDWTRGWAHSEEQSPNSTPLKIDDYLSWMRRARDHAEKLCRCFPKSEKSGDVALKIAVWAERWPQDYMEAKSRAEKSLAKIEAAIETVERQRQIGK
jgi:hypothetical protein